MGLRAIFKTLLVEIDLDYGVPICKVKRDHQCTLHVQYTSEECCTKDIILNSPAGMICGGGNSK